MKTAFCLPFIVGIIAAAGAGLLPGAVSLPVRAGEPGGPVPSPAERPKTGYEAFLAKGRIVDFPERSWEQAFVYSSQCYTVRTNTSTDVAEYAGVLMDAVHYHYCQRFGIGGTQRSNICVFRTKEEMAAYGRKHCQWTPPANSIGFFSTVNGGTICVVWKELVGQKPEIVLMHEGTHQFVHAVFREALPIWLNEGFAVYFENSCFDGRNLDVGRLPVARLLQLQAQMRQDKHVTLEKLFATEQKNFSVAHYGSAWAFVFWLAHGGDERELQVHQAALGRFVADCRQGRKDGKALAGYLGRAGGMDALEKEWKEWVLGLDASDSYGGVRPPDPRNFDPRANDAVKKMAGYLAGLKSLKLDFAGPDGTGSLALRRPDRLAVSVRTGDKEYRLVSDGRKVSAGLKGKGGYQMIDAPSSAGAALGVPLAAASAMRTPAVRLLASLVGLRPYNSALSGAEKLEYLGTEDVGGAKCHRVKVVRKEGGFELWVADGDRPLAMKFRPLEPVAAAESLFSNWAPDAELADEVFKY